MTHPIKTIYNFILTIQLVCLIIFIFYLFENNMTVTIPFTIDFGISSWDDYTFNFVFNWGWIIGIIIFVFALSLISSLNVLGSGMNDEGSKTVKHFVMFLVKYFVLNVPVLFLLSRSEVLYGYQVIISLIILIIYFLNYMIELSDEKEG